ncbi:efflux transporter periplasmic adaptor subunit, partial [Escherichia coli]|nr:efflux transporter periplasmic adaptor subunit [Escherichia coli]
VDESTGSITLRAVFPNPQQGVSRTPRGDATVLIVNDKSQVEVRPVVASQAIGDKWLISEGLKSGDQVIVSGLQKARPGEQVKATTDTPADTASK